MGNILSAISDFMTKVLVIGLVTSGILLFAGEVKLAALKKASKGSSKLSGFTERMTHTRLPIMR